MQLHFKRSLFQHYRGFIGRGNNSQLLFQLFKQSRWWWNLFSAPVLDENGKVIMQHGQTSTQLLREDFKEHNFIFTQWKKMMHFNVLKSMKVRDPAPENPDPSGTATGQSSRAMSPMAPGHRNAKNDKQNNDKDADAVPE